MASTGAGALGREDGECAGAGRGGDGERGCSGAAGMGADVQGRREEGRPGRASDDQRAPGARPWRAWSEAPTAAAKLGEGTYGDGIDGEEGGIEGGPYHGRIEGDDEVGDTVKAADRAPVAADAVGEE